MAALHDHRHDVFVSYAHDDNLPVAGADVGFVSQLVGDLKKEIGRKVGRSLDVWWDHYSLAGNTQVTQEIMSAAADCASIVVIASPAYLRSEWCGHERNAFLQMSEPAGRSGRGVFLVRIEPIDQTRLPAGLRDFTGYEFYRALEDGRTTRPLRAALSSDQETYYNRLSQLAQDVATHIERLQSEAPCVCSAATPVAAESQQNPAVLLLEVTDDLVQRRAELKDYLEQLGVTVLPEKRYSRDDMKLHRQQMLADLERSRVAVQLLGPHAGDRSDHARGAAWLRHDTIRMAGGKTPFLQWRDPDLDLSLVGDADARQLVEPASVRTDRFPDFRRAVGEMALKPPPRPTPAPGNNVMSVFVNADLLDRDLGDGVAGWLASHGFMVLEPSGSTEDAREQWETNLRHCDSLLLMYGQTKPSWVKTQILLSNKVAREAPLKLLSVCVGPPKPNPTRDKAEDLALRYSAIHYLHNEDSPQPDPVEMERFADKLREVHA
jgi:TIR domain